MTLSLVLAIVILQRPSGDTLTFDAAVARARARRGQISAAAARVAEARASYRVAGAIPNPTASYSRTEDTPHQHLTVSQSLEWILRRGAARSAAQATIRQAEADSAQVIAGVLADVRRAFYGSLAAEETLRLVSDQAAIADSLAFFADRRLAAGDISQFERDQIALEASRGRQLVSRARENRRVSLAALAREVGWEDSTPPHPVGSLDALLELPRLVTDSELAALPAIRTAVAESAAAVQQLRSVTRARIPFPSLEAGADWDDPGTHRALSVIGIAIPLPLWHTGAGEAAVARARALQAAAATREARLEAARRLAETEVRLAEAVVRARMARDSLLPAARRLRERATEAYRAGETGTLPVLDALRAEREVTTGAVEELLGYQESLASWEALVGPTR